MTKIFKDNDGQIFYVELEADTEERIRRNKTEYRLLHKPTKQNIERSEKELKSSMLEYRLNSSHGEFKEKNYLRIDNTNLNPVEVALQIKNKFNL